MWWRYAEPAAGITWSSHTCSGRPVPRRDRVALGRRAPARARRVNSGERPDRSATEIRQGTGADRVAGPERPTGGTAPRKTPPAPPSGPPPPGRGGPPRPAPAPRPIPPDGRPTAVIPAVTEDTARLRDPIDEVKAALDGTPPPKPPPGGPPGGRRPPGPPPGPRRALNWKWVRRGLIIGVVAIVVLPIVTFAMAYLIIDVPQPGDIRTNQVATILASDGTTEPAKIVPPQGNRVATNTHR